MENLRLREVAGLSLRPPTLESGIKARGLDRLLSWVASIGAGIEACQWGPERTSRNRPEGKRGQRWSRQGWVGKAEIVQAQEGRWRAGVVQTGVGGESRDSPSPGGEREGRDGPDQGVRVLGTELVEAQGQGWSRPRWGEGSSDSLSLTFFFKSG